MEWLDALLDVLLPPLCPACRSPAPSGPALLCRTCATLVEPLACPVVRPAPGVDELVAPLAYGGPVAAVLVGLKHGGRPGLAGRMARLALGHAAAPGGDLALPVPLHRRRLRRRGFNQAALVGRVLAREAGLPLAHGCLLRVRDTPSQGGLSPAGRLANVSGAFRARGVEGRRVVLVDDVWTTGATARACAEALLGAGALSVSAFAIARVE
jgi:ComF family protein